MGTVGVAMAACCHVKLAGEQAWRRVGWPWGVPTGGAGPRLDDQEGRAEQEEQRCFTRERRKPLRKQKIE